MRRILLRALLVGCAILPSGVSAQGIAALGGGEPEFLEARDVFRVEVAGAAGETVRFRASIAPGYYVYRHRLKLEAGGLARPLVLPHGLPKTDEFFGTTEVYRDVIEFDARPAGATTATLHWQGCADAGICYPPQKLTLSLPATVEASEPLAAAPSGSRSAPGMNAPAGGESDPAPHAAGDVPAVPTARTSEKALSGPVTPAPVRGSDATLGSPVDRLAREVAAAPLADDEALARRLADSGLVVAIAVFFGLGLLLAFTPCTLPMVPIVSSLVLGGRPSPRRALMLSFAYVLPMAVTYAGLGVAAGLSGANLQAALQQPWLLAGFAALFVVLALAMFGAFELQLPAGLRNRLDRAGRGQSGGTVAGAAAMGLLSALLVGPCMTAPLAGALLFIGQSGDPVTGGVALFALGLGMGLPLLLIATFGARILPKPGPWMARVKAGFGFLLLALAVSMAGRALPAPVTLALWGAWLFTVAAGLMALGAMHAAGHLGRWAPRALAAIVAVWAVALMLGGAAGASDPWRPLEGVGSSTATASTAAPKLSYVEVKSNEEVLQRLAEAGKRGQWTLVDFYADWCVSCHVIERDVFGDPEVAAALARMQVLRPDVTANDATDQALMRAWHVVGPPTLLLVGPDGRERRALRTTGEIEPAQFLARLERASAGDL
ncbi:MAG: protein-disulfide reductase DsbD [Steroidobacteraceae bacterium]|nr:protein-disulfide reductase DsbD [Steroidobacteraceae bacterium]